MADFHDAVTDMVTLLRAETVEPIASAVVEAYLRDEPVPTGLTVYVDVDRVPVEEFGIGGSTLLKWVLAVIFEIPWKDPETAGDTLAGAVAQYETIVRANRQLSCGVRRGSVGETADPQNGKVFFVRRPVADSGYRGRRCVMFTKYDLTSFGG